MTDQEHEAATLRRLTAEYPDLVSSLRNPFAVNLE